VQWRRRNKRRLVVLVAATAVCVIAVMSLRAVREAQQQRLVAESRQAGLAAFAAGDMNATLSHLSYYFERQKEDLEVNLAFAQARARLPIAGGRHLLEAIDLYSTHGLKLVERQPQLDPDGTRRRDMLARLLELYCAAGMRFEIIQTADKLLAVDAEHQQAMAAKAEALCLNGEFQAAQPILERLIELDADELRWRGMYLTALSETGASADQRIERCRQWAGEYERDGRFHVLMASLLLDQGREPEARDELEKAVKRGAADPNVLERAGDMMDSLNMREQADRMMDAVVAGRAGESWPHEVNMRRLWRANRIDEAVRAMNEANDAVSSKTPSLRRMMTLVCIAAREVEQAREYYAALQNDDQIGCTDADRAWANAVHAALHPESHALHWRIEALNQALELQPNDAALHALAGDAWIGASEPAYAIAHYQRAYEIDPSWQAAGILYCQSLLHAGRIDDAYHIAQFILNQTSQTQVRPLLLFARAYLAMRAAGRLDHQTLRSPEVDGDIRTILQHLRDENPGNAEIAALHAESVLQLDGADALDALTRATQTDGSASIDLMLALADVYLNHNLPAPRELLKTMVQRSGATLPVAWRQARTSALEGNAAAGLDAINHAMSSHPPLSADDYIARIEYMIQHELPGVVDEVAVLLARFPNSIPAQQLVLSQPSAHVDADLTAQALENLKRLVGPDSPQVRLAEAGLMLREPASNDATLAKAIVQIESVLQQSPDSLAALTLMAEAVSRGANQNLSRAVECLERAVNLYTAEPALLPRLIDLLQRKGDYDRAGRYLRVLARIPSASQGLRKAELRLWHSQGDFEAALARASALVSTDSSTTDQLILASIHHHAGKIQEARTIYERLLSLDKPEPFVLAQAADFFASTGELQRGVDLISRIEPADTRATGDLIVGEFLLRHGEVQAAASHLHAGSDALPQCAAARAVLARYHLAVHDRAKARHEALEGIRLDPENTSLRLLFAIASLGMSQDERRHAIDVLRQLEGADDELVATLSLLDQIPVAEGKVSPSDSLLESARKLVDQHSRFLPAWHLAITLHAEAGRLHEAISLARRAVGRFPADPEPAQWSMELLMRAGQWQAALADAHEWARRVPVESMNVQLTVATILLELDRASEAVEHLEPLCDALIDDRDRAPERLALYIRALVMAGQVDRALPIVPPLLEQDGRWRQLWLGLALSVNDEHAPQMLALLESTSTSPSPQDLLHLAGAWIELGKSGCDSCLEHATAIAARVAESGEPHANLGALMIRGGIAEARHDWKDAESLYRQALARDPQHALALNNLASVLARNPQHCDQALAMIDQALQVQPDHPDFLDTKAIILLNMNRPAEAEQIARKAVQLRPDDLRIALSLAEAHLHQANKDGDAIIKDLHQRIQLQRRIDPDLVIRFEALREKHQQSLIETGT
jgi:tetratricopeptide (TPR) repeat protein